MTHGPTRLPGSPIHSIQAPERAWKTSTFLCLGMPIDAEVPGRNQTELPASLGGSRRHGMDEDPKDRALRIAYRLCSAAMAVDG